MAESLFPPLFVTIFSKKSAVRKNSEFFAAPYGESLWRRKLRRIVRHFFNFLAFSYKRNAAADKYGIFFPLLQRLAHKGCILRPLEKFSAFSLKISVKNFSWLKRKIGFES